ncbi:Bromodomain-containing protein, partial [Blyttiomyces helicus]
MSTIDAKICKQLIVSLQRHSSAWPFLRPVNPIAAGAPDYLDVIKKPMDLSTIESKLLKSSYGSPADMVADVRLMLNNCYLYNPPTNLVHQLARSLEAYFS